MPIIRLSKEETKLLLTLLDKNIVEYKLQVFAGPTHGRDAKPIYNWAKNLRQKIANQFYGKAGKVDENKTTI